MLNRLRYKYPRRIDLSLKRVFSLLERFGRPQIRLPPVIHVAGTNGKGSTIAFLRAILNAHGYVTHVYTSPHLISFTERIVVAGNQIESNELIALLLECERVSEELPLTFFEFTTVAAILAFSQTNADFTLLETGLGGRLDATNVVDRPELTILTSISLDHQAYLGNTIEEIAVEKAGIFKKEVPAIVAHQNSGARNTILACVASLHIPLFEEGLAWQTAPSTTGFVYTEACTCWKLPVPALTGRHQITNAGTAIAATRRLIGVASQRDHTARGLRNTVWPARLQRIPGELFAPPVSPEWEIWLDGGHNPGAADILSDHIQICNDRPYHLIVGMLRSKDAEKFLSKLANNVMSFTAVPIRDQEDCFLPDELIDIMHKFKVFCYRADSVSNALQIVTSNHEAGRILVCGSLYLAGSILKDLNVSNLIRVT